MIIPHLNRRDMEVLSFLVQFLVCTSYRLSQLTDIPSSSVWRTMLRLVTLGLVSKEDRGFRITPKGLAISYFMTTKSAVRDKALENLKEEWRYNGNVEELRCFLNSLLSYVEKRGISPLSLCYQDPLNLAMMMVLNDERLSMNAEKMIGRLVLEKFPSVTTSRGCRAVLSYDSDWRAYALAVDCRVSGMKIFHRCPFLTEEVNNLIKGK